MNKKIVKGLLGLTVCCILFGGVACSHKEEIDWDAKGKPTELIVKTYPHKTEYLQGDIFDDDGLIIDAKYEDGSVQENIAYKIKTTDPLKVGEQQIRIVYNGAHTNIEIMVDYKGNAEQYSVANTEVISSPLSGKTIFWLGSSVTYGEGGCGESMADFIQKRDGVVTIKEAVSGTTLRAKGDGTSYVERLENYLSGEKVAKLDAFVCQLSTNDMYELGKFGEITANDVKDLSAFNKKTTYGAIEYIIATVKSNYDCPILFYTNQNIEKENYENMVNNLLTISRKWNVEVLDLYHDASVNGISEDEKILYLRDNIHPTRAGYREWWTPVFEAKLIEMTK